MSSIGTYLLVFVFISKAYIVIRSYHHHSSIMCSFIHRFNIYSASSLDGPRGRPGGPGGPVRPARGAGPGFFFQQPPKVACVALGPNSPKGACLVLGPIS